MRKLSNITESVWGDIRKRSTGETTRREDDIDRLNRDEFYEYLKDIYVPVNQFIKINNYDLFNEILVPILIKDDNWNQSEKVSVSIEYQEEKTFIAISSSQLKKSAPELEDILENNYYIEEIDKTGDRGKHIRIYPKGTNENFTITNSFFVDVVDFLLDNVKEPHIKLLKRK